MEGIKIIIKYLKPYKKTLIFLSFFSIVSAAANAIIPYLAGRLIDALISFQPVFFSILFIWLGIKIIADLIDWRIGLKSGQLNAIVEADYNAAGFGKILEFPIKFHKTHKIGEIGDKINRAAHHLSDLASWALIELAPQFLSILFAFSIIFWVKPKFGIILIGALSIYVFIIILSASKLGILFQKMHRAYNRAFGDAYETIFNVATVKQATAEDFEKEKLKQNFRFRAVPFWIKITSIWQQLSFGQKLIITLTQFSIFIYSFYLIRAGQMTVGQLVMFNAYAAMIFGPFVVLARNWHTFQNGIAALKIAEKILSYPTEIYTPTNATTIPKIKGKIIFKNINFSYEGKQGLILNNINFEVLSGEKVALVGESGVGKSTLIDLISFYYPPTSGEIFIDDVNIKNLDLKNLRSQIGIVPQEVILFNDTIKNNIRYGRFDATDEKIIAASKQAHADEFIEKFPLKYNQIVGERGIKLSVGQKQRVAIARALLRNPRILILDEPTSALDAKTEKLIQESLEKLMGSRTTFIIAHRLSTVRRADKILALEKGQIVEAGSHEELLKKPDGVYRRFYELQIGLI